MGRRRKGRELAVQALYRAELTGDASPEGLALLWERFEAPLEARRFAGDLFSAVLRDQDRLDRRLTTLLENWSLDRLSRVDRNILRVAAHEIVAAAGVPPAVAINEAIEIARRFGGEESAHFVNGVLDRLAQEERGAPAEERGA